MTTLTPFYMIQIPNGYAVIERATGNVATLNGEPCEYTETPERMYRAQLAAGYALATLNGIKKSTGATRYSKQGAWRGRRA